MSGKIANINRFKRFHWQSLVGISRLRPPRTVSLKLLLGETHKEQITDIHITKRDFETKSFDLAATKTSLLTGDAQDNSWAVINAARKRSNPNKLWEGLFMLPTKGEKTLGYGDNLYINGQAAGSHFGHDYANKPGTPIYAANTGKIVLAEFTPSFGNTIMIDHGQNVFTLYLHNSAIKTELGSPVKKRRPYSPYGFEWHCHRLPPTLQPLGRGCYCGWGGMVWDGVLSFSPFIIQNKRSPNAQGKHWSSFIKG